MCMAREFSRGSARSARPRRTTTALRSLCAAGAWLLGCFSAVLEGAGRVLVEVGLEAEGVALLQGPLEPVRLLVHGLAVHGDRPAELVAGLRVDRDQIDVAADPARDVDRPGVMARGDVLPGLEAPRIRDLEVLAERHPQLRRGGRVGLDRELPATAVPDRRGDAVGGLLGRIVADDRPF